jgi:hypothetical protein
LIVQPSYYSVKFVGRSLIWYLDYGSNLVACSTTGNNCATSFGVIFGISNYSDFNVIVSSFFLLDLESARISKKESMEILTLQLVIQTLTRVVYFPIVEKTFPKSSDVIIPSQWEIYISDLLSSIFHL